MTVACPSCGLRREITARSHRRNVAEGKSTKCPTCLHPRPVKVEERHRRYWLSWAGVTLDSNANSIEWVKEHGLPDALRPIADSVSILPPDFHRRP